MKCIRNIIAILICCLGMANLLSCQGNLYYADYHDMPGRTWDRRDTVSFDIPAPDADMDVKMTVSLRHDTGYGYDQMVLRAIVADASGHVSSDVAVKTKPGSNGTRQGVMYTDCFSSPMTLHLKAGKPCKVRIAHRMRLNPVDGIASVAVTLEK